MVILYGSTYTREAMKRILVVLKLIYMNILSPNKVAEISGIKFGKNCHFNTKSFGSEPYLIQIGDNFYTSKGVNFVTHDGSVNVIRNLYPEYKKVDLFGQIQIGNNVFIGINTNILPNTLIEDNVIVGASSLVKGQLKSNSVYAGVPAKYICSIEDYLEKYKKDFDFTKHLSHTQKKDFLLHKYFHLQSKYKK